MPNGHDPPHPAAVRRKGCVLTVTGLRHRCLRMPIAAHNAPQGSRQPCSPLEAAHSRHCALQPSNTGRCAVRRNRKVQAQAQGRDWQNITLPAARRQRAAQSSRQAARQPRKPPQLPDPDTVAEQSAPAQAQQLVRQAGVSLAAAALAVIMNAAPAPAADTAKVGTCLLASCQRELVGCLADANCAKNLVCLQTCNGRPDETDCQVNMPPVVMPCSWWVSQDRSEPHADAPSCHLHLCAHADCLGCCCKTVLFYNGRS